MTREIDSKKADCPIAWRQTSPITRAEFLNDVFQIAEALPAGVFILNLCEDRYNALVAFAAAMTRGQVSLFPSSVAPDALVRLGAQYPTLFAVFDGAKLPVELRSWRLFCAGGEKAAREPLPDISPDKPVIHAFTSGSTGTAQATIKNWGALVAGAKALAQRVDAAIGRSYVIVATVPSGHSYGIETTIMPVLLGDCAVSTSRPLFPSDVADALDAVPRPRCLVTTPYHLKAMTSSNVEFPDIDLVMSATAPLPTALAQQAEGRLGSRILEIYGCTESGFIATRWTSDGGDWVTRDDMRLIRTGDGYSVTADFLPNPVVLADLIVPSTDQTFELLGRSTDLINIAGKRASLSGMNRILLQIDGIDDGAIVFLEDDGTAEINRPIALAVSSRVSREEIRRIFRTQVDPVFVPRQVLLVDRLPRNETGKLPLERIRALIDEVGAKQK